MTDGVSGGGYPVSGLDFGLTWLHVDSTDDRLRGLYERHYSAKKNRWRREAPCWQPGLARIVGPGEFMAMLTPNCLAGWVWRLSQHRDDGQEGIECVFFRNEWGNGCKNGSHPHNSGFMVHDADTLADVRWPGQRHFTHVDPREIESPNPGYCFKCAGWRNQRDRDGELKTTLRGLIVLERLGPRPSALEPGSPHA